jgi:hypothetical protein
MSRSNPDKSGWSEGDVERLLRGFYREEMPASLREQRRAVSAPVRTETSSGAGLLVLGLLVSAACLFFAVLVFSPGEEEPRLADGTNSPDAAPAADSTETHPDASSVAETAPVHERVRYDTESGPVEQRTNLSWKNVSVEDETGEGVEVMIPELQIDVFPIDEEPDAPERGASDVERQP